MTVFKIPSAATVRDRDNDMDRAAQALRIGIRLRDPRLHKAVELIQAKSYAAASRLLKECLREHPEDAQVLYLWGEALSAVGRHYDAQALLAKCLEIEPDFVAARYARGVALLSAHRPEAAIAEIDQLLRREPQNPLFRALKAEALVSAGDHPAATALWRELIQQFPTRPESWERCGHAMRVMGRLEDCIAAYRRHIELVPSRGKGWWNLADLKTFRFDSADVERMEVQLARTDLSSEDRTYLHFALGKAYADLEFFEKSFANYANGNALRNLRAFYDPQVVTAYVARCKRIFTADFFRQRSDSGCASIDPVFIVGMPRSGSTLVEQILASHSQIEGTRELDDLPRILDKVIRKSLVGEGDHPVDLDTIEPAVFKKLGEAYLERAGAYRKSARPFFTDKMGSNYMLVGLIQLILPNARIIDVRRHPMACCFSNFIQMFASDKKNATRLADIALNYRDYVDLMAHFDAVLPGRVHRVIYEELVERPELEIRRLLDHLGLRFETSCLQFHKTGRMADTVSAEQVRRPINRDGVDQWRNYEPWLGPLKSALGALVDLYPEVPAFD